MIKQNKGAIGETLTWAVAFFIVLFIMLIFIVFTGFLAGKKEISSKIPFSGGSDIKINILKTSDSLETQRKLFYILNYPYENSILKDIIINWIATDSSDEKEKISLAIKKILEENIENTCYLFKVNEETFFNNFYDNFDKDRINTATFTLFSNNQKINIELSSKKC